MGDQRERRSSRRCRHPGRHRLPRLACAAAPFAPSASRSAASPSWPSTDARRGSRRPTAAALHGWAHLDGCTRIPVGLSAVVPFGVAECVSAERGCPVSHAGRGDRRRATPPSAGQRDHQSRLGEFGKRVGKLSAGLSVSRSVGRCRPIGSSACSWGCADCTIHAPCPDGCLRRPGFAHLWPAFRRALRGARQRCRWRPAATAPLRGDGSRISPVQLRATEERQPLSSSAGKSLPRGFVPDAASR